MSPYAFGDGRVPRRIWDKLVVTDSGCWLWLGARMGHTATDPVGYGAVRFEGPMWRVHRLLFALFVRTPAADEHVHHECRNRLCANPAHLRALAASEHCGHQHRDKTHCKHGHPFDEANTQIRPNGRRRCRACQRRLSMESRQRCGSGG